MQYTPPIFILWDSSHIWGLMTWRALHALGLACRLTKGCEIAAGILQEKDDSHDFACKLLLVPGGNARLKAQALGSRGCAAIREYVSQGGSYLGFCGGAGLALTTPQSIDSLNICSWSRKPYPDRLQHLISGHVQATVEPSVWTLPSLCNRTVSLPIWWPGRFMQKNDPSVHILAKAQKEDSDFWLGDLALKTIPDHIIALWKAEYGLDLSSDFLKNMPLVVGGNFGKGAYILSYSHLETPESEDANRWLASLVAHLSGQKTQSQIVPAWNLQNTPDCWEKTSYTAPLYEAFESTRNLLTLASSQHLFFQRTSWLWGWKSGLPGAMLNSLNTALHTVLSLVPTEKAKAYWMTKYEEFSKTQRLFAVSAEESLLTSRITGVLGDFLPHAVRQKDRKDRQLAIFGCPRNGGGLLGKLLEDTEEILYLSQENRQ